MSKVIKRKFKIEGMHCSSCAMLIDGYLEDHEGVFAANTNFAKQEVEVEFDEEMLTDEKIIITIEETGYKVTG